MTKARVSQAGSQVLGNITDPKVIATQGGAMAPILKDGGATRASQAGAQVVWFKTDPTALVTRAGIRVVYRHKPPRVPKPPIVMSSMEMESTGIVGDPIYDKVELLITCEDQGIKDLSKKRRRLTYYAHGGPGLNTNSRYGNYCLKFGWRSETLEDCAGSLIVDGADGGFMLGKGPFTLECWLNCPSTGPTNRPLFGVWSDVGGSLSWGARINNGKVQFLSTPDGSTINSIEGPTIPFGEWFHLAIDRDSDGVVRIYYDGEKVASDTHDYTFNPVRGNLRVGFFGETSIFPDTGPGAYNGYMDDLRITRGWARYRTDDTFRAPDYTLPHKPLPSNGYTAGDPHYDKVVLLLDPLESTDTVDYSANPATITGSFGAESSVFQGASTTLFDADAISVTVDGSGGRFNLNGPMTLEAVFLHKASTANSHRLMEIAGHCRLFINRNGFWLNRYKNGSEQTIFEHYGGSWSYLRHFVMTRDEYGTSRFYVDGRYISKVLDDVWDDPSDPDADLVFNPAMGSILAMVVGPVRITKGVARWTHEETMFGPDMGLGERYPKVQAIALDPVEEPSYPANLVLQNPGAEQKILDQWTIAAGSKLEQVGDPDVTPRTGDYAYGTGRGNRSWFYQKVPVPNDYWEDVDAECVQLIARAWTIGSAEDVSGGLYVAALNDQGEVLYTHIEAVTGSEDWTEVTHTFRLPPTTRMIRVGGRLLKDGEGAIDLYWDDFELEVDFDDTDEHVLLTARANPTEWISGTGDALREAMGAFGQSLIGVNGNQLSAFQTITLPEELIEDIDDAETPITVVVDYHLVGVPDGAGGSRIFLEYRDTTLLTKGVIYDAETHYDASLVGEERTFEVKLPEGARVLVFGIEAEGEDGFTVHPLVQATVRLEWRDSEVEFQEPPSQGVNPEDWEDAWDNVLVDPGFDDKNAEVWNCNPGLFATYGTSYPFTGTPRPWSGSMLHPTASILSLVAYQDVPVNSAWYGFTAMLTGYEMQDGPGDPTHTRLAALDALGNVLAEVETQPTSHTPQEKWFKKVLTLTIPAGTVHLRVELTSEFTDGSYSNGAFDDYRLRIGEFSDQLLTNPSFEENTTPPATGWTEVQGRFRIISLTTPHAAEGSYCLGEGEGPINIVEQVVSVPEGWGPGDLAILRAMRGNNFAIDGGELRLEALDADDNVIWRETTGYETLTEDKWFERVLSFRMPVGTEKLRVRFEGALEDGSVANAMLDDLELVCYRNPVIAKQTEEEGAPAPQTYDVFPETYSGRVLLLPFDGEGDAYLTDLAGHTFSVTGTVSKATDEVKFGDGALDLRASSGINYISTPHHEDFHFGNGPFAIAFWMYHTDNSNVQGIITKYLASTGNRSWAIRIDSAGIEWLSSNNGTSNTGITISPPIPLNTWTHILIERDLDAKMRTFVNGQCVSHKPVPYASLHLNSSQPLRIGNYNNNANGNFRGILDDILIVKGRVLIGHDFGFTPPAEPWPMPPPAEVTSLRALTVLKPVPTTAQISSLRSLVVVKEPE